nr:unnamed protein product [Callosobruchus chinensis]
MIVCCFVYKKITPRCFIKPKSRSTPKEEINLSNVHLPRTALRASPMTMMKCAGVKGEESEGPSERAQSGIELYNLLSKKLKNKNSSGYDEVPVFLIKAALHLIIDALLYLVNLSLLNGAFPNVLKTGKVIPIYKKGDNQNINNYRPITMPSVFSKVALKSFIHPDIAKKLFPKNIKKDPFQISSAHGTSTEQYT